SGYAAVIAALEERGSVHRGRDWQCPAHEDRTPSLGVKEGEDGRALIKCQAGCEPEAIVKALGLSMADLFAEADVERSIAATYDYHDDDGTLLFQVVRYFPKDFRQRRPDGNGGWIWNMQGVRRVPFHVPQLVAGVIEDEPIYIVEGEKDVLAVEAVGGVATCNPMGAGKWRSDYAPYFDGAGVIVVMDK